MKQQRQDIEVSVSDLESGSNVSCAFVSVTRADGSKARVWLDVRFNNKNQVEAILTVRKKNGKDVDKRAIAEWREPS